MKKRVAGMLLALALLVNLLMPILPQAQAATVSSYEPYANISYDYSSAVVSGTIRYISQKPGTSKFYSKYWGKYEERASYNCSTSCISMALSYIGIDTTPIDILDYNILTVFMASYGGCTPKSYTYDKVSTAVDNYINGNGKYSPPVIHLDNYSAGGHYVMLIGRISDNKYQVLDPATLNIWTITINGSKATYNSPFSGNKITDNIDNTGTGDVYQWYNSKSSIMKDVTVFRGEKAEVSVYATGDSLKYTWYFADKGSDEFSKSTIATGKTYSVEMNSARDGRRVYCKVTDSNGNSIVSNTVTLNQVPTVDILKQPESVEVAEGEKATVTVSASGDGLKYEWYFADKGSSSFSKSETFRGDTYSVEMNDTPDGRRLYCKITDKYGQTVTTETVTISQRIKLAITQQPENAKAKMGQTAATTVEAVGDGLKYTWYYTTGGSATKFFESSNTTATYSTTMDSSRDGRKVYCKITDKYGNTVTTQTVTLTLDKADPVKITKQPENITVANGATAATTVEAVGDGLKYTWYFTSNGSSSKFNKSSTTTATYSTTMDSSRDGRKVYCVVTDQYGNTAKSNTVTLSMEKTPLVITQQPTSVTVVSGATAETAVKATGDGLKYTWYFTSNAADTSFGKSSITTATYSTTMDSSRDGRKVYCKITDAYGNTVTSNTVTLTMGQSQPPEPSEPSEPPVTVTLAITQQPENVTVANGETAKTSVVATGEGLTYTWYYTSNKSSSKFYKSSVTDATYSTVMDSSRDGRKVYCVVKDAKGNTVTSNTVTLTMGQSQPSEPSEPSEPPVTVTLAITQQPQNVTVANGETAKTSVVATGEGLTYTWYYTSNGSDSRFFVSSTTTATYSTTMDSSRDGRKIYCVIKDAKGNTVTSNTVTLRMSVDQPSEDPAPSNTNATITASGGLNIRNGAGSSYTVVGHYYNGDRVEILETKTVDSTVWGRTDKGWVSMDYVKLDVEIRTVTADSLTIRASASTSGKVVGYLYKGDKVTITETKTADGYTWGKCSKGWIALKYTKL